MHAASLNQKSHAKGSTRTTGGGKAMFYVLAKYGDIQMLRVVQSIYNMRWTCNFNIPCTICRLARNIHVIKIKRRENV